MYAFHCFQSNNSITAFYSSFLRVKVYNLLFVLWNNMFAFLPSNPERCWVTFKNCYYNICAYTHLCKSSCQNTAHSIWTNKTGHLRAHTQEWFSFLPLQLWEFLKPNTPLESRISKQWCEIGFQGDDPKTDFRGMGLLGLYNLQWVTWRMVGH